jgi:exosortase B
MSTVLEQRSLPGAGRWLPWLALAAGLLALYVPVFFTLARTLWREEDYAHGPIILAVAIYLGARMNFSALRRATPQGGEIRPAAGKKFFLAPFLGGLVLYFIGQSQNLPLFSTASMVPVVAGAIGLLAGWPAVRAFAFPVLFLFFLIPLPGFLVEMATGPLRQFVSAIAAGLLGLLGYAVERHGVVLDMGGHEMLVADACSGMNSIVSLTALTLLYVHLTGPSKPRRWIVLLASVVPIAIAANMLRVLALVLVAYHFGDEAAQGWVHTAAGLLVFVSAFLMLVGLDSLVGGRLKDHGGNLANPESQSNDATRSTYLGPIAVAAMMVGTALAAPLLKPVRAEGPAPVLESMVPQAFGDWSIDPTIVPVAPTADVQAKLDRIYNQTVSRTYVNAAGEYIMLTVAYGGDQSDALKAHRQEVCYTAQGFSIHDLHDDAVAAQGKSIPVTRMVAVREDRVEPVTYWFTMGDRVVRGRLERLGMQLREGFSGRIPDGVLVRVSSISTDPARAYAAQQAFVAELLAAMPADDRVRLAGAPLH